MPIQPDPKGLLAGKRGLIIGGTSGLGLAAAEQIVAWGGQVIPASSNPAKVAAALENLGQPDQLPPLTVDARRKASLTECVRQAAKALGKLDFYVTLPVC